MGNDNLRLMLTSSHSNIIFQYHSSPPFGLYLLGEMGGAIEESPDTLLTQILWLCWVR